MTWRNVQDLMRAALPEGRTLSNSDAAMAFSLLLEKRAHVAAGLNPESALTMLRDEFGDEVASWSLDDSDVEAMYDALTPLLAVGTPFTPWLANLPAQGSGPAERPTGAGAARTARSIPG
jgi:hypothetical protein